MTNNYLRIKPLEKGVLTKKSFFGEPNQINLKYHEPKYIKDVLERAKSFGGYYEVVDGENGVFKLTKKRKLKSFPDATSKLQVYAFRDFYLRAIYEGEMALVYGKILGEEVKGVLNVKHVGDAEKGKNLEYTLIVHGINAPDDSEDSGQ